MRKRIISIVKSIFGNAVYNHLKSGSDRKVAKLTRVSLTTSEKDDIKQIWDRIGLRYNQEWFGFYKSFREVFSAQFVPKDIWRYFEIALNPYQYTSFAHKGLLDRFIDKKYLPDTLVNVINGNYFNCQGEFITQEDAAEILYGIDECIVKYSYGEGGGKAVSFIDMRSMSAEQQRKSAHSILSSSSDIIIQRILKTSDEVKKYNPHSVNTIRCVSLNLNGRTTVLSSFLRMSSSEKRNDNVCTGGWAVGINDDGQMCDFAVNGSFEKFYVAPSGISFAGNSLSSYQRIKEVAIEQHEHLPFLPIIGWDFTVDDDNNIRIIEINLCSQEEEFQQIFNGPLFGDRLNEVIEYVNSHKPERLIYF